MATAVGRAAGDGVVPGGDGEAASGGTEDQELPHQGAASAAEDSAAGNDRTTDHAAAAGVSQNCAGCFHAVARLQIAFPHPDFESSKAVRSTTTTPTSA